MLNKLFNKQTFHLIIFLIIFTLGLKYVICNYNKEGYTNLTKRCPNILIQKGSKFYLYNSKFLIDSKSNLSPNHLLPILAIL